MIFIYYIYSDEFIIEALFTLTRNHSKKNIKNQNNDNNLYPTSNSNRLGNVNESGTIKVLSCHSNFDENSFPQNYYRIKQTKVQNFNNQNYFEFIKNLNAQKVNVINVNKQNSNDQVSQNSNRQYSNINQYSNNKNSQNSNRQNSNINSNNNQNLNSQTQNSHSLNLSNQNFIKNSKSGIPTQQQKISNERTNSNKEEVKNKSINGNLNSSIRNSRYVKKDNLYDHLKMLYLLRNF